MKRALQASILLLVVLALVACAGNIQDITDKYTSSSLAVKHFARITSQDWLFGSGIIQGALQEPMLPAWVFEELQKVDAWFLEGKELNEWELGYLVGLRLRLAAPVIKAAIEQYAPGIISISEVGAVLAFIGL